MLTDNKQFMSNYSVIENAITSNINDPDTDRKSNRWVFPTFPEKKNYDNYPVIIIDIEEQEMVNQSAGDYYCEEQKQDGSYTITYGKRMNGNAKIYVMTEKNRAFTIDNNYLKEKPLNLYLRNKVMNALFKNREELLQNYSVFGPPRFNGGVYEDDSKTWVSEINVPVSYEFLFVEEYSSGELINSYELNKTIMVNE